MLLTLCVPFGRRVENHSQHQHEDVHDLSEPRVRHTDRQNVRRRLGVENKGEDGEDAAKNVSRHDEERNAEVAQYSWIS